MSKEFNPTDPDEIQRIKDMLNREGVVEPEEIERFIKQYSAKLIIPGFNLYSKNWQYADTKIVLGMHEKIEPFDIDLDPDVNEDFKLWSIEMGWDKK